MKPQGSFSWMLGIGNQFSPRRWLVGHYALLALIATLVIPALAFGLGRSASAPDALDLARQRYIELLQPYVFPGHFYVLVAFLFAGALAALALFLLQRTLRRVVPAETKRLFPWLVIADVLLLAYAAFQVGTGNAGLTVAGATTIALLSLAAVPELSLRIRWIERHRRVLAGAALAILFADLALTMSPFVLNAYPIPQDFFEIPTTTRLSSATVDPNHSASSRNTVDTLAYVNERRLFGNQLIYDPRVNPGSDPPCLVGNDLGRWPDDAGAALASAQRSLFYIHNRTGNLCFIGRLTPANLAGLRDLLGPEAGSVLADAAATNWMVYNRFDLGLTREEQAFANANALGFVHVNSDLERVFHHHFQILNPVHEFASGKSTRDIQTLYGLAYIPIYYLAEFTGGVSYQKVLSIVFASYFVYAVGLAVLIWWITRSVALAAGVLAVFVASTKALGVIGLYVGVGFAPLRHGLDLLLIAATFAYLSGARLVWLAVAIGAAVLGVWLDRSMGLFGVGALAGTLASRLASGHGGKGRELSALAVLSVGTILSIFLIGKETAPNPLLVHFVDGLFGFPVPLIYLVGVPALMVALYATTVTSVHRDGEQKKYIVVFMISYALLFSTYFLVLPEPGHLFTVVPIFAALIALYIALVMRDGMLKQVSLAIILLGSGGFWLLHSTNFLREANAHRAYVRNHEIYDWSFPRMQGRSVMQPALFAEASSLVAKFSEKQRSIYILSEYDVLMTYLADRVSGMPHFEMSAYLLLNERVDSTAAFLRDANAEYLFVDTCISCSALGTVPTRVLPGLAGDFQLNRARDRAARRRIMNRVFQQVERDYELVESSGLISVYRRRGPRSS